MKKIAEFKLGDCVKTEAGGDPLRKKDIVGIIVEIIIKHEVAIRYGAKVYNKTRFYCVAEVAPPPAPMFVADKYTVLEYTVVRSEAIPLEDLLTSPCEELRYLGVYLKRQEEIKKRAAKRLLALRGPLALLSL